ncbi:MAG: macro domain-containing protein [bacterium]|nr:macro domain-containing protein [bacterium]
MKTKIDNIEVVQGDLTSMNLDIIVNAANHTLLGGGGIDGVIHYKAGPELLEECKKLNGCEIGSAKMTNAYNLPCKKIIHACGPMYYGNREEAPIKLKECYKKCIELAEQYRIDNGLDKISIGFPCISTGIYGYPKDEACKIAIDTIRECISKNFEVKFVCYEELDYKLYLNYLNGINKGVFEL